MRIETGECIYCGQVNQFEVEDGIGLSEEEKNRKATEVCTCEEAKNVHDQEQILTKAQKNIKTLFHEDQPEMEMMLNEAMCFIYNGTLDKCTLTSGSTTGRVSITSKGMIKVERERKTKSSLES
ncbi:MAG TPA: hypothetical protein H9761_17080 [Candidatus Eisenbergiella merdavium]|uniref:Uncharacterized protein n=1 Tax=Candidatus Eisenbergiella merdavium TaxID=2838551 RepID=A0A9D2NKG4_9FIRM|nr:hypothetical protein [Candidatus Eisenbergiella merdavium]